MGGCEISHLYNKFKISHEKILTGLTWVDFPALSKVKIPDQINFEKLKLDFEKLKFKIKKLKWVSADLGFNFQKLKIQEKS